MIIYVQQFNLLYQNFAGLSKTALLIVNTVEILHFKNQDVESTKNSSYLFPVNHVRWTDNHSTSFSERGVLGNQPVAKTLIAV